MALVNFSHRSTSPELPSPVNLRAIATAYRDSLHSRQAILPMGPPVSAPWSILLELYLNAERYIPLSLGDMALLTGIAPTTSLDWLHKLSRMGLVAKVPDPGDGRRFHVSLTPQGTEVTEQLLSDLARVLVHSRNAQ